MNLCMIVVAVPAANAFTSTCGSLEESSFPFTSIMNFLNDKSNGFGTTIDALSSKFCGVSSTTTTGCSVFGASATD